jgi:hypothetical protein
LPWVCPRAPGRAACWKTPSLQAHHRKLCPAASEQPAQQPWLLLLHLHGGLGQVIGVLHPIVYAVPIDVRDALVLLACRLDQSLAEVHVLLEG